MSSIDERIVEMRIRNSQFVKGAKDSEKALEDLEKKLNFQNAGKGFDRIQAALNGISIDNIASSVDNVSSKFSVFGAIGFTALQRITNAAIDTGVKIKSAVLDPLIQGGERRAQNIAQAEFMLEGLGVTGDRLKAVMDAANYAVDGTAYGLDVAAMAASSFVASQVPIEKLPGSLRAVSGVAAMTGRSYEDISQIFTTVAGNGRLMASELNRIGQSGLNAAAALGNYLGVSEEEVRKMTSEGKINFETFAAAMDGAFGAQATKANDLYSGSLANLRAAFARIGQIPAEGKFEKLRLIFNALTPKINDIKNALLPFLNMWKDFQISSGKTMADMIGKIDLTDLKNAGQPLADGFRNIFRFIGELVAPIRKAWEAIFPPKESTTVLTDAATGFKNLTDKLKVSDEAAAGIQRTFEVLFRSLKFAGDTISAAFRYIRIGAEYAWDGIKVGVKYVRELYEQFMEMEIGGKKVRDILKDLGESIKTFGKEAWENLKDFFKDVKMGLDDFLSAKTFQEKLDALKRMFSSFSLGNLGGEDGLFKIDFKQIWDGVKTTLMTVWDYVYPVVKALLLFVRDTVTEIIDLFTQMTPEEMLALFNAGVIVASIILINKLLKSVRSMTDAFGGMAGSIGGAFDQARDTLKSWQNDIKSNILLKVAASVALFAASIWLLAQIPGDRLLYAVGGLAAATALLIGAVLILNKFVDDGDAAKLNAVSLAMLGLGAAVLLLSVSIEKLSRIDPEGLARGLGSVAGGILLLSGAVIAMSRWMGNSSFISGALAMALIAGNLWILASAVERFAKIPVEDLKKGGTSVGIALGAISAAMLALGAAMKMGNVLAAAAGVALVTLTLFALAKVLEMWAAIDTETLISGFLRVIGILTLLTLTATILGRFSGNFLSAAIGLGVLTLALAGIAGVIKLFSMLSGAEIAKGLLSIAGAILVLGFATSVIQRSLPGVGGLIGLAFGIAILAGAIYLLKDVPLGNIIVPMLGMAAVMIAMAFAANLMQRALPGVGLFIAAILALGVVAIAFAVAALIFVGALWLLGPAGKAAAGGIVAIAEACASVWQYVPAMVLIAVGILAIGIAAAVAGVAAILLGVGMLAMAAAMAIFAAVGPIAIVLMQSMVERIAGLVEHAGSLITMGAAFLVLGIGLGSFGIGALLAGAGLVVLSTGLMMFAAYGPIAIVAMQMLIPKLASMIQYAPQMLVLSLAFGALGGALLIFGIGAMLAGAAVTLFATGLRLMIAVGTKGAEVLGKVVAKISSLVKYSVQLGVMTLALGALGAALVVLGAGALLSGAGLILTAAGLAAIMLVGQPGADAMNIVTIALKNFTESAVGSAAIAGSVLTLARALAMIALSGIAAQAGLQSSANGMIVLRSAVSATASMVSSQVPTMVANYARIGPMFAQASQAAARAVLMLATGMLASIPTVQSAGVTVGLTGASAVISGAMQGSGGVYSAGFQIGSYISQGMAAGISSGVGGVIAAAAGVAAQALAAAKSALDIHSPSRETYWVGSMFIMGMVHSLVANGYQVARAAGDVAQGALGAISDKFAEEPGGMFDGIDMSPTIRPILDLTDVTAGARSLNTMFDSANLSPEMSNSRAQSAARDFAYAGSNENPGSNGVGGGRSVTYNQYNYSPKALSPTEVYRQTNNQLSRIRSGDDKED